MKKNLLLAAILFYTTAHAQHETDKWYFGVLAGLDFSSGTATVLTNGALNTSEGNATVSDATGSLLFYTDGVTVWNRSHQPMPNGTGLLGGTSCTQAALIVPLPGSTSVYYVFTNDEIGGPNGLEYSIVDMTLAGGLGDVTTKNFPVQINLTEKLCAIHQNNNIDFWIAVHEWGSDAFYVYPLTSAGLGTPVVSNTGMVHALGAIQYTNGQMKFSPCGDRIALATGYLDTVQVLDFNNVTGAVSNPVTIPMSDHTYGVEFSPQQNMLYASCYDPAATLQQFDLTAGNAAQITASMQVISTTADIYAIQLANDGKIYVSPSFHQYIGVINSPGTAGTNCNYVDNGVDLDPNFTGTTTGLGLPNIIPSYFKIKVVCNSLSVNEPEENIFSISPNPVVDELTIYDSQFVSGSVVTLTDAIGKIIYSVPASMPDIKIKTSNLPQGIYIVSLTNSNYAHVQKVVKID